MSNVPGMVRLLPVAETGCRTWTEGKYCVASDELQV
jgi:hypothetical protein